MFYEDNASKKRWILKFDDPKALAILMRCSFVTVEPNGVSHHASGKELLFVRLIALKEQSMHRGASCSKNRRF